MKKYLLLVAFLLGFIQAGKVLAVPDSCLTLYCPNDIVNYNPDKVNVDTCKDSPTYGDWYQSGTWILGFKKFFIRDSVDFVSYRNPAKIKGIDSVNFPELFYAFKIMDEKFGEITLKRDNYECFRNSDSAFYKDPCMIIYFNKRSRTKDIEYYLNRLPGITSVRMAKYPVKSNIPASCLTEIWPHNPPDSYNPD